MFESIEDFVREADEAGRAGVFHRTPIDARELLQRSTASLTGARASDQVGSRQLGPMGRAARAWLAAAAVFVLVGVGWNLIFFREFGEMRERLAIKDNKAKSGAALACLAGPTGDLPQDCGNYDYDSDGDMDLADMQSYQLAIAVNH